VTDGDTKAEEAANKIVAIVEKTKGFSEEVTELLKMLMDHKTTIAEHET
jgi:hypothetical protein